jgi:hypothetical protein
MDNLLASHSGVMRIALAPPKFLDRGSLVPPSKRCAAISYPSSRKASRSASLGLTATRIGAPNISTRKTPGGRKS